MLAGSSIIESKYVCELFLRLPEELNYIDCLCALLLGRKAGDEMLRFIPSQQKSEKYCLKGILEEALRRGWTIVHINIAQFIP